MGFHLILILNSVLQIDNFAFVRPRALLFLRDLLSTMSSDSEAPSLTLTFSVLVQKAGFVSTLKRNTFLGSKTFSIALELSFDALIFN